MKQIKLKVIAGKYKNRILISHSENTRETSSMVRGAVFNSLYNVSGLGLDLFGGSGAYGFEALSRGLDTIYINDIDKLAYKSIFENKQNLKTGEQCIISNLDYKKAIDKYNNQRLEFDYIFLDPPYEMTDIQTLLNKVSEVSKKGTTIVLEVNKETTIPKSYDSFILQKEKNYGIKKIAFYEKAS